jgi:hypothetical protein
MREKWCPCGWYPINLNPLCWISQLWMLGKLSVIFWHDIPITEPNTLNQSAMNAGEAVGHRVTWYPRWREIWFQLNLYWLRSNELKPLWQISWLCCQRTIQSNVDVKFQNEGVLTRVCIEYTLKHNSVARDWLESNELKPLWQISWLCCQRTIQSDVDLKFQNEGVLTRVCIEYTQQDNLDLDLTSNSIFLPHDLCQGLSWMCLCFSNSLLCGPRASDWSWVEFSCGRTNGWPDHTSTC